ncbi:putative PEP-CTERM system TPR-repeat lipoprotein [Phaeobacter sp. CECT 5382]|uniref:tetratricopeptide repeat-containing sulfotransferase family protein n=1 Tax=Phaeobacter sp. CECT 5382 TaxID=1712645 RepID=UPI0006D98DD8|nr:sulfotransferase [Phaeobacter sp. CECT 5382]CUH88821.1 putative PEP-CTERM system TPR-repeat lipoprotein [Phaeobacter sp. CECT 5382]
MPLTSSHKIPPAAFDRNLYEPLLKSRKFQDVLATLQPLVAGGPPDPGLLDLVADCYFGLERADRGIEVLEAIVSTWPDNLAAWGKLAVRSLQNGNKPRAAQAFDTILSHTPNSALTLSALYRAAPYAWDSSYSARLRQLIAAGNLTQTELASVNNTLGQVAFSSGHTDIAFQYFQEAKNATSGQYDPAKTAAKVTAQAQAFDPARLPEVPITGDTAQPLFIVGLPRSGTTLLESMLNAHPDVTTIGESPALIESRKAIQTYLRQHNAVAQDWSWCSDTDPALARAGRNAYLAHLSAQEATAPRISIDKLPQNLFEMGYARMILPEARFIFMMRHPLDIGLSLFTTNFHEGHAYSKDLRWIGHFIRANYDSLIDYIPKLGGRLQLQSYRQLVEHPEAQMRALLTRLDLDWDPACLTPQSTKGLVKTASLTQVRQGINRSGLDKWKPFEAQLAPLIEALGGWDWIKAWEAQDAALSTP